MSFKLDESNPPSPFKMNHLSEQLSNSSFQTILEALPVAILVSSQTEGRLLYANPAASRLFGLPIPILLQARQANFYLNSTEYQELLKYADQAGQVDNYELCCQKADGTSFWANLSLNPILFQGEPVLLHTLHDMTAYKSIETVMQEQEAFLALVSEREQAKLAAQAATDQLQAVLDAVPGFVSWVNAEGRYLGVNRHLANHYGLSSDQFFMCEIGFLEGKSQFSDFMQRFLASPNTEALRVVTIPISGGTRSYLIAAQKYQQGRAAVSVGIDITEQESMKEALLQSEVRNQAFLSAIPDLILRIHQDGIYLDVVEAKGAGIATSQPNPLGKHLEEVLPPELVQQYRYYIHQALATGETQEFEYQLTVGDRPCDYEARVVKSGDQEAIFIVRDITERKAALRERQQAEEALRIAEENYRSIFENALEGIFQSSPEGRYINVNPALAKIYGYDSPAEMIASITNIGEQLYVDPEKRTEFRHLLERQGTAQDFEYRCYCKDGRIIWTQIDARAVRDSNGKVLYYEGIVKDVTERRQREDDLLRQLNELKIEIDQKKRETEVALLTESSYFQEIQQEVADMDLDEFWS